MAYWGFRRGGLIGAALGVAGVALLARGVTGKDPVRDLLNGDAEGRALAKSHGWDSAAAVMHVATIEQDRSEVYRFWRDFENLGRLMENVEQVRMIDALRSHWRVRGPLGLQLEWESVITEDTPDRRIAWETAPGADVASAGWVEFKDAATGGVEVHVLVAYQPPLGQLGRLIAKALRIEPAIQVERALERFKLMAESAPIEARARGRA